MTSRFSIRSNARDELKTTTVGRGALVATNKKFAPRSLLILLGLMTPLVLFFAIAVGPVLISFSQLWQLLPHLIFTTAPQEQGLQSAYQVISQIRLPRVLLAWIVGSCLAIAGAAMQGLFRNPLADPSIIGVTSGASLGASIAIVLVSGSTAAFAGLSVLVIGAFVGGLLSVLLVYRLSSNTSGASVSTMLLVGIAITALAGAINSGLAYFADNEMLRRISLWNMGALDVADTSRLLLALVVTLPASFLLLFFHRQLDALLLGESEARHLGVDVSRLKKTLVLLVALSVGSSVALAGVISFVGLVVPHMLRMLIGPSHRFLLPTTAVAGGLLLVLADALARTIVSPSELPVGVITALLGAPFFLLLLFRSPS